MESVRVVRRPFVLKEILSFNLDFLKNKINVQENKNKLICYLILTVMAFFVFSPIIYALLTSFMSTKDIITGRIFPKTFNFENYKELGKRIPMDIFFYNTMVVSLVGMILQIITCSLAAYAVVFIDFKNKNRMYSLILLSMFIPWEAIFIPNYITILKMNLLDTKLAIVFPFITNGLGAFLMVQQFKSLNKSLIEAAKIDGCSDIYIYSKIVMPLSKSILGTWGVYSFLNLWNMYLWPLMTSTRPTSRTIQIGLKMMMVEDGVTDFGVIMAAVVVVTLPSLLVLFLGQTQLQKGITSGAVKE